MKLQKWVKLIDLNPEWNLFCFFGLLQSLWIWLLMKHSQVVNDNNNVKILFLDSDSSVVHSITARPGPGSPGPESILYIHNIPAFLHDTGMLRKYCIIRESLRRTFWRIIITYSLALCVDWCTDIDSRLIPRKAELLFLFSIYNGIHENKTSFILWLRLSSR